MELEGSLGPPCSWFTIITHTSIAYVTSNDRILSMVGRQREERKIWQKVSYLQSNTENISLYRLREGNKPVCAAFVEAGEKQRP